MRSLPNMEPKFARKVEPIPPKVTRRTQQGQRLPELHDHEAAGVFAFHVQQRAAFVFGFRERVAEVVDTGDSLVIYFGNEVVWLQARLGSRAAFVNVSDEYAFGVFVA